MIRIIPVSSLAHAKAGNDNSHNVIYMQKQKSKKCRKNYNKIAFFIVDKEV